MSNDSQKSSNSPEATVVPSIKKIKCTKCDHDLFIPQIQPGDIIDVMVQGMGVTLTAMKVDGVSEEENSVVLSGGLIRGIKLDLHRLMVLKRNGASTANPHGSGEVLEQQQQPEAKAAPAVAEEPAKAPEAPTPIAKGKRKNKEAAATSPKKV